MTNEEKSVGIGSHFRDSLISFGVKRENAEKISLFTQQAAIEMADWKDTQYKIKLDALINFICDCCLEHPHDKDVLQIEGFGGLDGFVKKLEEIMKK